MTERTGNKELGNRLKELRDKNHLTQQDLADASKIAISTIQKIESAKQYGRKETHEALAKVLGVSVSYLLYGDEGKPKSRIPDLPPDEPPLTPDEIAALNDPRLGGIFYSKPYLSRLSNRQLRQIALDALSLIKEIEEGEDQEQ